jgi:L-fuculose-phosphate aldolase
MDEKELIAQLNWTGQKMVDTGLVAGPGGNISARLGDVVYLSPSGYALDEIGDSWVKVDVHTAKPLPEQLRPTSETLMHVYCYQRRKDMKALVHTHSPYASGMCSAGLGPGIRPMFAEIVCDIGEIGFLNFIVPTTEDLANAVADLAPNHNVLLLENHGVFAFGTNLKQAFYRVHIMEEAAKSIIAASAIGKPRFLTAEEQQAILNLDSTKYRRKVADEYD